MNALNFEGMMMKEVVNIVHGCKLTGQEPQQLRVHAASPDATWVRSVMSDVWSSLTPELRDTMSCALTWSPRTLTLLAVVAVLPLARAMLRFCLGRRNATRLIGTAWRTVALAIPAAVFVLAEDCNMGCAYPSMLFAYMQTLCATHDCLEIDDHRNMHAFVNVVVRWLAAWLAVSMWRRAWTFRAPRGGRGRAAAPR